MINDDDDDEHVLSHTNSEKKSQIPFSTTSMTPHVKTHVSLSCPKKTVQTCYCKNPHFGTISIRVSPLYNSLMLEVGDLES